NELGQLGSGERSSYPTPRFVPLQAGFEPEEIAAGNGFTCVRSSQGNVDCFGLEPPAELGAADDLDAVTKACRAKELEAWICDSLTRNPPRAKPGASRGQPLVRLPRPTDAKAISAGDGGLCVLARSGGVRCHVMHGPGDFPGMVGTSGEPPIIAGTEKAVSVVGGAQRGCVQKRDGEVACWSFEAAAKPIADTKDARQIAMGTDGTACVVLSDGRL